MRRTTTTLFKRGAASSIALSSSSSTTTSNFFTSTVIRCRPIERRLLSSTSGVFGAQKRSLYITPPLGTTAIGQSVLGRLNARFLRKDFHSSVRQDPYIIDRSETIEGNMFRMSVVTLVLATLGVIYWAVVETRSKEEPSPYSPTPRAAPPAKGTELSKSAVDPKSFTSDNRQAVYGVTTSNPSLPPADHLDPGVDRHPAKIPSLDHIVTSSGGDKEVGGVSRR